MFDLGGKTALVTGATGGIGGAIARGLHRQGAILALSGTRKEALDQLALELKERVHVLPCDLADKEQVEALVPKAEEAMGKLDILVANAGVTKDNLFVQLRDEDWDSVININLTATFRLSRAAMKTMMRRRFGRIIGITSVVGVTGNPGQGNYTAAKAGMIGMMKSIAKEYAKRGVTANCVAPGFITSPMTDKLNDKQREAIIADGAVRPARDRRRHRLGRRLSRLQRSFVCHRPDAACEWRNGDDMIIKSLSFLGLCGLLANGFEVW